MQLQKSHGLLISSVLSIAAVIASCQSSRVKYPYTLNDSYKTANLSDRKLVVVFPSDGHIVIKNKNDVIDDFGGLNAKPEARIRKFYFPEFFDSFKSFISGDSIAVFDQVCPGLLWDTLAKKEIVLKTGLDSAGIRYFIPDTSFINEKGLAGAVLIIIQEMTFKRNNFQIEYYWDDQTRKPANLEVNARLVIWDYKSNSPVFYGTISEQTVFHFGMQRQHWDQSARTLAKKIVMNAKCL